MKKRQKLFINEKIYFILPGFDKMTNMPLYPLHGTNTIIGQYSVFITAMLDRVLDNKLSLTYKNNKYQASFKQADLQNQ